MLFDSIKFLTDYNVKYSTEHHHCKPGNINIHCPFCTGKDNFHLGIFPEGNSYCWRCGKHTLKELVKQITQAQYINPIIVKYLTDEAHPILKISPKVEVQNNKIELPYGTIKMGDRHRKYLESRNFIPEQLEQEWDLQGTGIFGLYRNRIIAPIYFKNVLVSYQGRDITNISSLRYKACAKRDEIIQHKHTLYAIDKVKGDSLVVVEGITDVWRLGAGAVSTFGIEWTDEQLYLLSQFKKIFIWYDNQEQATKQAEKLAYELAIMSEVNIVEGVKGKDPAELEQAQADDYMEELGFRNEFLKV